MRRYGWKPDIPDHRDRVFRVAKPVPLPPSVDLRAQCPPVYDQGELGSCTANAIAAAIDFDRIRQGEAPISPSRLFIYYNERALEHTTRTDAGAQIRDGIKSIVKQGACPEEMWPYDVAAFARRPRKACYARALDCQALVYERLDNRDLNALKAALASGVPFVFGMSVYEAFESMDVALAGNVPMPRPKERLIGAHAVLCVGYDDTTGKFLVRNSWGTNWGIKGYFTIPYQYLADPNLCDDFWVVRKVE